MSLPEQLLVRLGGKGEVMVQERVGSGIIREKFERVNSVSY